MRLETVVRFEAPVATRGCPRELTVMSPGVFLEGQVWQGLPATNPEASTMTKRGHEYTSRRVARISSSILRSKTAGKAAKSAAGSALTQRPNRKHN